MSAKTRRSLFLCRPAVDSRTLARSRASPRRRFRFIFLCEPSFEAGNGVENARRNSGRMEVFVAPRESEWGAVGCWSGVYARWHGCRCRVAFATRAVLQSLILKQKRVVVFVAPLWEFSFAPDALVRFVSHHNFLLLFPIPS